MHSCSSSPEMATRLLDLGCYFSLSGTITRQNAKRARRLAGFLPDDRLLLETDSPSMGISGVDQPNISHIGMIFEELCRIRKQKKEELSSVIYRNTNRLFGQRLETVLAIKENDGR